MGMEGAPQKRVDDVEKAREMAEASDAYHTHAASLRGAAERTDVVAGFKEKLAEHTFDEREKAKGMSDEELKTALENAINEYNNFVGNERRDIGMAVSDSENVKDSRHLGEQMRAHYDAQDELGNKVLLLETTYQVLEDEIKDRAEKKG
jgi:hypothetical protein